MILNGTLYQGHNCGAGEIGRIGYRDGRLTDYCSGKFFLREYQMSGTELFQRARAGEAPPAKAFERFGWHLGKGLAMLVHVVDPQIIVLGGGIAGAFELFEAPMSASLAESVYQRSYARLKVAVSSLRESAVLGAASLCWPRQVADS